MTGFPKEDILSQLAYDTVAAISDILFDCTSILSQSGDSHI